jgi:hypothetical protein
MSRSGWIMVVAGVALLFVGVGLDAWALADYL